MRSALINLRRKAVLATFGKYLIAKLATEVFIKRVCLATAKHLASLSSNRLDDELVDALDEALND